MSHRDKYSSSGSGDSRRHSSSSRRESPSRRTSRRSPNPGPSRGVRSISPGRIIPRDPKNLPEAFGHVAQTTDIDDSNVIQRMRSYYVNSPLHDLYKCIVEEKKVKIWTRNYKEVRGILTGYVIAFDKHWNLILKDVDEVYLKPKKSKTPFLRDVETNEALPDMPPKAPRQKKTAAEGETSSEPPAPKIKEEKADEPEKKKRRKKKSKVNTRKRAIRKLFVRGDNIVMVHPYDEAEGENEGENENEETETENQGG